LTGQDAVVLKGGRDGVAVIIDEGATIDAAIRDLRAKLSHAGSFFKGAAFRLEAGRRTLTLAERDALSSTMEEFGIKLRESGGANGVGDEVETPSVVEPRNQRPLRGSSDAVGSTLSGGEDQTLLVKRTIRSGQRIDYEGNVVVMGDVNAGAVVMSTGDIVVLGSLRGLAHAGAQGNDDAVVMAFRLEPTQLRISQYISRPPDEGGPRPDGPEVARVRNGVIQIEAYVP